MNVVIIVFQISGLKEASRLRFLKALRLDRANHAMPNHKQFAFLFYFISLNLKKKWINRLNQ